MQVVYFVECFQKLIKAAPPLLASRPDLSPDVIQDPVSGFHYRKELLNIEHVDVNKPPAAGNVQPIRNDVSECSSGFTSITTYVHSLPESSNIELSRKLEKKFGKQNRPYELVSYFSGLF